MFRSSWYMHKSMTGMIKKYARRAKSYDEIVFGAWKTISEKHHWKKNTTMRYAMGKIYKFKKPWKRNRIKEMAARVIFKFMNVRRLGFFLGTARRRVREEYENTLWRHRYLMYQQLVQCVRKFLQLSPDLSVFVFVSLPQLDIRIKFAFLCSQKNG